MENVSIATLEIDVPSLLVGVGAGVATTDFLASSLYASFGVLSVAGVAMGVGYIMQRYTDE